MEKRYDEFTKLHRVSAVGASPTAINRLKGQRQYTISKKLILLILKELFFFQRGDYSNNK